MASPADPAAAGRPALRMPLLLAPLLLALLLGACAPVAISGNRPPAAHHRDDGFVNSDGTRVNKPLGDLLRWWWSRRDLDLDARVHPDRITAAWRSMPPAWRAATANAPDEPEAWRVLPVGVDAGAGDAPAGPG